MQETEPQNQTQYELQNGRCEASGGDGAGDVGEDLAHFVVLQGPSFGDVCRLEGEDLVLGSDPFRADAVIRDATVEPRHAEVIACGDCGYVVRDLSGSTRVNGELADGRHTLLDGDRVFLGSSVLEFSCGDPIKSRFHDSLNRLINEDYLTGLLSKSRFNEEFEHSLKAARADRQPLSILMADIDNLKKINDAHGHLIGEFAVGEVGSVIGSLHRADGRFATRFGGDEYQSILPGLTREEALGVAEKVRSTVEEYTFKRNGVSTNPTLSIGVATYPGDGDTPETLTRAADAALYRAKSSGGNTVRD
ncbi:GGDEF domain-containing protein [Rubrobacter aplysinae]|uniref:GGDEF domain-containing protein n=1 Tax=Rubrobacter aplysinae TaxID=909625 RepID=UPI00064C1170|nr:GGDEF domain-containing protein [Rubrobacter aplysinae]